MSQSTEPTKPSPEEQRDAGTVQTAPLTGLTTEQAAQRLTRYGPNAWSERHVSRLRQLLGYFWGPIPWMIEIAALLSAVVGHWADLTIILVLLGFNAGVGFWQEYQAGNAIAQLKKSLALTARVLRDGQWRGIPARELVPDDVVRIRLGDVVPADIELLQGDYLTIDQSALTGESLPVDKKAGDTAYSGTAVKQGEMVGRVTATGMQTYFGKTAGLVSSAKSASHFQKAVMAIGDYLIYLALALVVILILVGLERQWPLLELAQFALILTVASIPVAMPAVLSVTMAVGALALSRRKAIVSRLESIEEIAGMAILCSDKTGTLTQNRLTLGNPVCFAAADNDALILAAALASKAENGDPIDLAVIAGVRDPASLNAYHQSHFIPFDPISKRTQVTVQTDNGKPFKLSKGAPQVIMQRCQLDDVSRAAAEQRIEQLANKGFRTLGVARQDDREWQFLGLLPLFDPPRDDAAETIANARRHGVDIKMVTGDNLAIARETAGQLGLGDHILSADGLNLSPDGQLAPEVTATLSQADGFAQVFPEHKFALVKALQEQGHIVGMTGDGVNDAPALKQADVGIAVSGATDAARASADLVLTAPGLSVIVQAVEEARRIFQRMNAYAIYRITETIRIMIFMVLAILMYGFYPITAVMIILLALLNDLPIMTIAKDNTWLPPKPVRWEMTQVLSVASVLGIMGVASTFLLLIIARTWLQLEMDQIQTVIFLKLAIAGHLTLLVARTHRPFFAPPYPAPILLVAILCTQSIAVLIAAFGWFVTPIPWSMIGGIILYALAWMLINDLIKLAVYRVINRQASHQKRFLSALKQSFHQHPPAQSR
ncbi:plasma-membrane proton-efflux P-type ATPase [Sedimenticola thiotaurini]|uniref:Metal ABC transporter ATPase n=1 Tax=Sedimenticola thiotaurini TaxID=1543721 RepID=A0A0F7JZN9_9GAMM|nr:plasma-membrane proton-efflux P-type ATPase [Sedimenticola thiotaurini]AKH21117.1 metal ABC transporter ATPase [Sedimenticola thiotaurini]